MANKKYIDFPAGTYDTAKVFLQADTTTGDLEQINLPTIPTVPFNKSIVVDSNNSGSNPQTLATITIPATSFDPTGTFVDIIAAGEILSTTGTPQANVVVTGSAPATVVGTVTGVWTHLTTIWRISSSQFKMVQRVIRVNSFSSVSGIQLVSLATGNDLVIDLKNTAGGANTMYHLGISAAVRTA